MDTTGDTDCIHPRPNYMKLILYERTPVIGRLLAHWGLGIALGGMHSENLSTMILGTAISTIGQLLVAFTEKRK